MSSIHSFGVTMPNTPYVRAKLTQLGFVSSDYSLNSRQPLKRGYLSSWFSNSCIPKPITSNNITGANHGTE